MDIVKETLRFVNEYHANDCSGHGPDHVLRVWETAKQLGVWEAARHEMAADKGEVNMLVLELAALLHDVDDHKINPGGHVAENFLNKMGVNPLIIRRVVETIGAVSFSVSGAHPKFDTIEQCLLSDADKLDAMGAIGVCRAVAYGAVKGRKLYKPQPTEENNQEPSASEEATTVGHFYEKLLLLKGAMQSEAGKREAERRHDFLVAFLEELEREVGKINN